MHGFRDTLNQGMRNVTISLDDELARWVRVRAAELDKSVSKMIAEILQREMLANTDYKKAMEEFLAQPAYLKRDPNRPLPTREEIYDRPVFRRHERSDL